MNAVWEMLKSIVRNFGLENGSHQAHNGSVVLHKTNTTAAHSLRTLEKFGFSFSGQWSLTTIPTIMLPENFIVSEEAAPYILCSHSIYLVTRWRTSTRAHISIGHFLKVFTWWKETAQRFVFHRLCSKFQFNDPIVSILSSGVCNCQNIKIFKRFKVGVKE